MADEKPIDVPAVEPDGPPAPPPGAEPGRRRRSDRGARRCVMCWSTVPAPRRKVCSDFCAHKREMMLQDYRRKRARS